MMEVYLLADTPVVKRCADFSRRQRHACCNIRNLHRLKFVLADKVSWEEMQSKQYDVYLLPYLPLTNTISIL